MTNTLIDLTNATIGANFQTAFNSLHVTCKKKKTQIKFCRKGNINGNTDFCTSTGSQVLVQTIGHIWNHVE